MSLRRKPESTDKNSMNAGSRVKPGMTILRANCLYNNFEFNWINIKQADNFGNFHLPDVRMLKHPAGFAFESYRLNEIY
jgi:hypothetical protein